MSADSSTLLAVLTLATVSLLFALQTAERGETPLPPLPEWCDDVVAATSYIGPQVAAKPT